MEVLVPKLSSFKISSPICCTSIKTRRSSFIGFRFHRLASSVCASTVNEEVTKPALSTSLGHSTRPDFPILHQEVNSSKLVDLDNAATSQKPTNVLKKVQSYYEAYNSNVHHGIHFLSVKATDAYELARKKVAAFVNASDSREIVFTRNAAEAINLVSYTWGLSNLKPEDEIILTVAEHHSAIVPWQIVAQRVGAVLKFVDLNQDESPDVDKLKEMISSKTKLIVVHHVSNVLASVLPIEEIAHWAHDVGAKLLVDACQSVPHKVVDVQSLNVDFLVASSRKMCGPTGIGFLYGKSGILSSMPPFLGWGEMISDVYLDHSTYADPPLRFEAGTPATGEAIGLGAAIDYLSEIGMQKIHDYEVDIYSLARKWREIVDKVRAKELQPHEYSTVNHFRIDDLQENGRSWVSSLLFGPLLSMVSPQVAYASDTLKTNEIYVIGELFDLGIQLLYLILLLALLGAGTYFVIRQVLVRRELDLSAKELQEQVRSGDASATELFELGAVMLRRKFYPAANKYLLQAIEKWDGDDQDLAQVYNALGVSYIRDGKLEKGISQFEKAVKLQPGYVTAWNNLGDAYEKKKEYKSALKAFEEVLLFDPNNKVARPRRDAMKEQVEMYKGVPVKSKDR